MSLITQGIADYLSEVKIPVRLASTTESGWPVVLSLWFLYEDGHLYCATQRSAKIAAYLRNNPQCAFEIAGDLPPYCGVRGQAIAHIDTERGVEILKRLLTRYLGDIENPLAQKLLAKQDEEVAIVLKPVSVFTWNYSSRMNDSLPETAIVKVCPPHAG